MPNSSGTAEKTVYDVPFRPRASLPYMQDEASKHMAKRSSYQKRVIKDYYQNRDAIMLQRLGEMVTDLYLAEGKKRAGIWKRVAVALEKLKVPPTQIDHLVQSDNPALVAELLKTLLDQG